MNELIAIFAIIGFVWVMTSIGKGIVWLMEIAEKITDNIK